MGFGGAGGGGGGGGFVVVFVMTGAFGVVGTAAGVVGAAVGGAVVEDVVIGAAGWTATGGLACVFGGALGDPRAAMAEMAITGRTHKPIANPATSNSTLGRVFSRDHHPEREIG